MTVLVGSWIVAWELPAPKSCVSINCGANFNPDQVTWRWLSFWNWPRSIVVGLGLVLSVTMTILAFVPRRASDTDPGT
jgi:hypothetical protein